MLPWADALRAWRVYTHCACNMMYCNVIEWNGMDPSEVEKREHYQRSP
jgi:hypothetical protein